MTFGKEGTVGKEMACIFKREIRSIYCCFLGSRVYNLKDIEAIFDVFQAHGHTEVRKGFDVVATELTFS